MSSSGQEKRTTRVEETSAGGFVLASTGPARVALIGRKTRTERIEWCVPKGHPEGDESIEAAAVREVFEETGIECEIITPLGTIDYRFQAAGKLIHKTVHHFLFRQIGGELNVENDPDHEAIDAKWVELDALSGILSHENERRMALGVIEWVERNG